MLIPTLRASFLSSLLLAAFSSCALYGQIIVTTADDEDDGFTIDANGEVTNHRILKIKSGVHVSFDGITFTGGAVGGGIFVEAAGDGTTVQLKNCTISGNSAVSSGGGICVDHTVGSLRLSLVNCTISDNHSDRNGGGIDIRAFSASSPSLTLRSCTLTKNSAENSSGGIFGSASGSPSSCSINLDNSILANTGSDLRAISGGPNNMTTVTATGVNILSNTAGSGFSASSEGIMVIPDPMLAPLGDYGGPTQTTPPLPGSPAINAAGNVDPEGTDQRGLPRFADGALDIGAVEYQGDGVELAHTFYLDSDSDGILNGVELAIGTDPDVADQENANNLQLSFNEMGQAQLSFGLDHALQSKITLSLMRSTDLKNFDVEVMSNVTTDFSDPGTENLLMLEDPNPPAEGKAFYHLKAQLR